MVHTIQETEHYQDFDVLPAPPPPEMIMLLNQVLRNLIFFCLPSFLMYARTISGTLFRSACFSTLSGITLCVL